jgi:heterodisulfide reductase subunit A2
MMSRHVIVIGGGVAGMEAAGQLSKAGFSVSLIEKEKETGGNLRNWYKLFPDRRNSTEVMDYLKKQIALPGIIIMNSTTVEKLQNVRNRFILMTNEGTEVYADALVVATGFTLFNTSRKEEYGYGIYDNVIASADLEAMFKNGKITMSDGRTPETVGMVHCVGSRDEKVGNLYCSKLCCVTAVKQAIEIVEHLPDTKVFCFYMDMRMGGAMYEEMYREAQEKFSVNFIRGKVSEVSESIKNKLVVKVEDTLAGRPLKIELDTLVLMAGMEMSAGGKKIADLAKLSTGENRFFQPVDNHYANNLSNIKGIFYAGTCTAPMNITDTISHARAAVSEVVAYLNNLKN